MDNQQVSFAKHNIFYKMFFERHAGLLESFIDLKYNNLSKGYLNLLTFYSSYSYYLRDGSLINEVIIKERNDLINNKDYINIQKIESFNNKLNVDQLIIKNELFYKHLINIFEKFQEFCQKLAPDSIMPDLTSSISDYERNVLFASYETFYENFFNFHSKISEMLNKFSIFTFLDMFKSLMAFYYGYSYYLSKYVCLDVEEKFRETWALYQNKDFITILHKVLNSNYRDNDMKLFKDKQYEIFININKIFDIINNDLPKKNLMPKKKDKINIDTTGI